MCYSQHSWVCRHFPDKLRKNILTKAMHNKQPNATHPQRYRLHKNVFIFLISNSVQVKSNSCKKKCIRTKRNPQTNDTQQAMQTHKRNDCKQVKRSTLQFIHRNTHTTFHASTKSVNVWVLSTISVEWRDFIADTQSYNEIHRKGTAIPNASTEWNGMDTKNHSTGCMS